VQKKTSQTKQQKNGKIKLLNNFGIAALVFLGKFAAIRWQIF
jgi:hypothetical protein